LGAQLAARKAELEDDISTDDDMTPPPGGRKERGQVGRLMKATR
jgi:hypothetical protein